MVATDLNLTVETLKPKDDNSDTGLAKKVRREFLLLPIKLIRRRWSSCHKVYNIWTRFNIKQYLYPDR